MAVNPNTGWPYPVGTDLVKDGDNAIKAVADLLPGRGLIEAASAVSTSIPTSAWTGAFTANPGGTYNGPDGTPGAHLDATSIIIDKAGWWDITLTVLFAAAAGGRRGVGFTRATGAPGDPPADNEYTVIGGPVAAGTVIVKMTDCFLFPAAQRVFLRAFQDTGSAVAVTTRRVLAARRW